MVPWTYPNPKPKRYLHRLNRFCGAYYCDRPTDRPRYSVCNNRLRLQYLMLRCGLIATSGQSNLTGGRIAVEHGRCSRIRKVAPMCTPRKTCFLGPIRVHNPNGISIGSAVYAKLTAERSYTLQRAAFSPLKITPSDTRDLQPDLIRGSLGQLECITQRLSRSVQPFLRLTIVTDRETDIPLYLVCNNRLHVRT